MVPLGHRLRPAGTGPRRRRQVPARRAGLRRLPSARRLLRRAFGDQPGGDARPLVPDRRRPRAHGQGRQGHPEDLSIRPGRRRPLDRALPRGRGRTRTQRRAQGAGLSRGHRTGGQHHPAQRLRLLRDARPAGAERACDGDRPRADGTHRRDRDQEGPGVCARRPDEGHPRGGGEGRQRHRPHAQLFAARSGLVLVRRLAMVEPALPGRLQLRDAAAGDHGRGRQALSAHRLQAERRPDLVLLRRDRDHPGDGDAADRRGVAVPLRHQGRCRRLVRRRQDLQGDAPEGHPGRGVLVLHALRQPDPLNAEDAAEVPARRVRRPILRRRRRRSRTARRRSGSRPSSPRASPAATGSRRTRRRAGWRCCGSTAQRRPSSTSPGGRPRSRWSSRRGAGRRQSAKIGKVT